MILSFDRLKKVTTEPGSRVRGSVVFRIVALSLIAALLLVPAIAALRYVRRVGLERDKLLGDAPRQIIEQIVVLVLLLACLAIAVAFHIGPF